eukprot:1219431-Ditylum_brightwellii.AAC.1
MIKELVKDILQVESKEIIPDIVATILQQIKLNTDKSLRIVKDVPLQTKATITDITSVLTQGATTKSSSVSDDTSRYPSEHNTESNNNLLTQDDDKNQSSVECSESKAGNCKKIMSQETQSRKNTLLQSRRSPWINAENT